MAIAAPAPRGPTSDHRFFFVTALVIAMIFVIGFTTQLAAGRSSFAAPPIVHLHAVVFFGWVAIFVLQGALAVRGSRGSIGLHRRLGWLGLGWSMAMVGVGIALMLHVVRGGTTPFFFQPQYFLVANLLSLFGFAALTWAAVAMRRRTDWHRRLHLAGITLILGPAFGRLLPMPIMIPWSFQIAVVCSMVVLVVVASLDARRLGRWHPAWTCGLAVSVGLLVAAQIITFSPVGSAIYAVATKGSAGALVAPLDFAPPPRMQTTGR